MIRQCRETDAVPSPHAPFDDSLAALRRAQGCREKGRRPRGIEFGDGPSALPVSPLGEGEGPCSEHRPLVGSGGGERLVGLLDVVARDERTGWRLARRRRRKAAPGPEPVRVAQDRALEKAHFVRCCVPVAPHRVLHTAADLTRVADDLLPGILKTTRLGYDGKGQVRVKDAAALRTAWQDLKQVPCVLEKMLPLALECSVIVARGRDAQMVNFPVQRNLHREGILAVTEVYEGHLPNALQEKVIAAARSIAEGVNYVGVLCVEFFVLQDGSMVVNEMAPRPHNSGHYTIDACATSQFAQQVRAMMKVR